MQFDQLLQRIGQQIDAGQLQQAEIALRQILQQQPRNGFALHLMGILAYRAGKVEMAVEFIEQAIKSLPKVAQFRLNIAEIYRLLGRLDDAITHGKKAVKLNSSNAVAHCNLGIAYYDHKEYALAEACQKKALKLDKNLVPALNNLGCICCTYRERKKKEMGVKYFRKVLDISPGDLEARSNLGGTLVQLERPKEAIVELDAVLEANQGYADAYANKGVALLLLEESDQAETILRKSLALQPGNVTALVGLARVHKEKNNSIEAQALVNQVLAVEPENAEVHSLLGEIYLQREYYVEAEEVFHKAIKLDPRLVSAYLGLGQIQTELGQIDAACASFEHAMAIDPDNIMPHIFLSRVRKLSRDDPSLARMEAKITKIDELTPTNAVSLHFALGKTYDGLKEYNKAFPHFSEGCRLKRTQLTYNDNAFDSVCMDIRTFFSRDKIDQLCGAGSSSDVPIFILGMPRSGTTLVETIIANHPEVYGAGELHDLDNIARQPHPNAQPIGYPSSLNSITKEDLTAMGNRYVDAVSARADSVRHITDKMPGHFLMLGLIHLILPSAKIVHVKRNALDTCLSGFMQQFGARTQPHSYDLGEMGHYYVNYARMMEHWREVLPDDAFYDLQYEELVTDKENQIRRLIDYCGLEWDDACLKSHESSRGVKTASIIQVRQPVYTSSVERWRHYEQYLQPLIDALGAYAPS